MRQAARLLAQRDGADVQLLDLVDAADGHAALLAQRQAVREAAAVEGRHEVHLRSWATFWEVLYDATVLILLSLAVFNGLCQAVWKAAAEDR